MLFFGKGLRGTDPLPRISTPAEGGRQTGRTLANLRRERGKNEEGSISRRVSSLSFSPGEKDGGE